MSFASALRVLLAALALWLPPQAFAENTGLEPLRFTEAMFALGSGANGATLEWRAVSLPDDWSRRRPGAGGVGRYRIGFSLSAAPQEPYAVYIRRVSAQGRVFVNDIYVGGGAFDEQPTRNFGNRAQLFVVPPGLLHAGENMIEIQVLGYANFRSGLSAIELGSEARLRPEFDRRYLLQTIGPLVTSSITGAIAIFALVLWAQRRSEQMYGYFGVATLIWALRNLNLYMVETALPPYAWTVFALSGNGLFFIFFAFFLLRYTGTHWPWLERTLWTLALLGPLSILVAGWDAMHPTLTAWGMALLPLSLLLLFLSVRHAWRSARTEAVLIAASFLLYAAFNLRDWMILRGMLAYDALFLSHYTGLMMFLAVSWMLARRFVGALDQSEQMSQRLEQRVAERAEQLRESYLRLQDAERRNAAYDERQGIVRDMHDGLGSQLVWMVHLARRGRIAPQDFVQYLHECLDELRLTIEVLSPHESDLLAALGALRHRIEPRLRAAGLDLEWKIEDIPDATGLSSREVLQVTRIVQEAMTNTLKHAQAARIVVESRFDPETDTIRVTIADNGCGFDQNSSETSGRGLENMRRRAREIGAAIAFDSAPGGVSVTLSLPLAHRPAAADMDKASPNFIH